MRIILPIILERGRLTKGHYGSKKGNGPFGAFLIEAPGGGMLRIIANGSHPISEGWEHVSISCENRCPTWEEMSFVKNLFWLPEECAIQFHPPESKYINFHPYCLHLWKPPFEVPLPPSILIGPK